MIGIFAFVIMIFGIGCTLWMAISGFKERKIYGYTGFIIGIIGVVLILCISAVLTYQIIM